MKDHYFKKEISNKFEKKQNKKQGSLHSQPGTWKYTLECGQVSFGLAINVF